MNITSRSSNVREVQTEEEDGQHLHNEHLETGLLRICVSWVSGMEKVAVREGGMIADIAEAVLAEPDVPAAHKLFIYRGLLLDSQLTVQTAGLSEGCTLYMVLNDAPFKGQPLHVRRAADNAIITLSCSPSFSIFEVKHELACYPGEREPTQMRLAFAGRELQDSYTLRQYNIQKPSVLLLIAPPAATRSLSNFVEAVHPPRDALGV